MFITEQHIEDKVQVEGGKRVFHVGMRLVNPHHVKAKFTYKELTLVLGIFVAMIVAITLWSHRNASQRSEQTVTTSNKVTPTLHSIVKKAVSLVNL